MEQHHNNCCCTTIVNNIPLAIGNATAALLVGISRNPGLQNKFLALYSNAIVLIKHNGNVSPLSVIEATKIYTFMQTNTEVINT